MNIVIHSKGVDLTDTLRQFVDQHLRFVLTRYGAHIISINVMLLDINGPKGGLDKCCRVQLKLDHLPKIIVQDTQVNVYAAIKMCSVRLKRTVERNIRKLEFKPTFNKHPSFNLDAR